MRKRINLRGISDLLLTLLVMFGTISLAWVGLTETKSVPVSTEPAEDLSNIPSDALVILIDAGHGGFDGGAVGSKTGVVEADLNLEVSKKLENELTSRGCYVIMTRSDADAIGESKNKDMQARKALMQLERVDIVISIHMNKFKDSTVSGPMVFYMKGSDRGRLLAESVIFSICEKTGRPQRAANPEDLFVLRVPKAPSILVECGFLSNSEDESLLVTSDYQQKLVKGIADGIADFLANEKNGDTE